MKKPIKVWPKVVWPVDNKTFLKAFQEYLPKVKPLRKKYKQKCKVLLKKGIPKSKLPKFERPQTPEYNYIGECLVLIAQHLTRKGFFSTTPYIEEMIGDALENAVLCLENFNPRKYKNPFSYFTQIMTYAFYRRISKEEKHKYIKQMSIRSMVDFFATQKGDNGEYANTFIKFMRELQNDTIEKFEANKNKKKKPIKKQPKKIIGIEKFMVCR